MQKKGLFSVDQLHFEKVIKAHQPLIHSWLQKPHVLPYFYGQGLENTHRDLEHFIKNEPSVHKHWVAYYENIPFAYLMNSEITSEDEPYGKWVQEERGMTLDLLIGDTDFLGKGLAPYLIQKFLKEKARDYKDIFIDPSATNLKAIHVYEKAGFEKIETFIASWDPTLHVLLKLNWSKVV